MKAETQVYLQYIIKYRDAAAGFSKKKKNKRLKKQQGKTTARNMNFWDGPDGCLPSIEHWRPIW